MEPESAETWAARARSLADALQQAGASDQEDRDEASERLGDLLFSFVAEGDSPIDQPCLSECSQVATVEAMAAFSSTLPSLGFWNVWKQLVAWRAEERWGLVDNVSALRSRGLLSAALNRLADTAATANVTFTAQSTLR